MKEGDDILNRSFNDPVSDEVRIARDIVGLPDVLGVSLVEILVGEDGIPVEEEFRLDPVWGPIETQRRLGEWRGDRYSITRGLPAVPGLEGLPEHEIFYRRLQALSSGQKKCWEAYFVRRWEQLNGPGGP